MFYGETESLEARYPGLDYSSDAHRSRLSRHCGHRKLFEAIDRLYLSPNEIYQLCDWEGSLHMKHKYEKENNTTVEDTTGNEVVEYHGPPVYHQEENAEEDKGEMEEDDEEDEEVMSETKSEPDEDEDEEPEDVSATFQQGENGLSYFGMFLDTARREGDGLFSRESTPERDFQGITREQSRAWRFIMGFDLAALRDSGFGDEFPLSE